jgi:outer membrane lipopolysaccharide assembly protein LptE/RlpB
MRSASAVGSAIRARSSGRLFRRRSVLALAGLVAVAALASGCGYALVGRGSTLPPEVKSVYLKPLENLTPRAQVEQILTRALATELVTRRTFDVASSLEGADAELSGAVTSFVLTPVSFDAEGRATQYEISIVVNVQLKQIVPEKVLYKNDGYLFRASYEIQSSELGYQDRETPAIERTAEDFAETLVTDLLEGF